MDAEEEETPSKPFSPVEQESVTTSGAPEELPTTALQCQSELEDLQHVGGEDEPVVPPLGPASGEEEKGMIAGGLGEAVGTSTNMENRDKAEVANNEVKAVDEVAETTEVAVGADMGEAVKEAVVSDEEVKNEGLKIADLTNEGLEMKMTSEGEDTAYVAGEEIVEDSIALKMEAAEEGKDTGISDPSAKERDLDDPVKDSVDGIDMEDETMEATERVDERGVAEDTNVVDMAVETRKMEEKVEEATLPDMVMEKDEKGTEAAEVRNLAHTIDQAEADGHSMDDEIREGDDEVEVAEELNVVGSGEEVDAAGAEEEAWEAEETEVPNEADMMEEEGDAADTAEDAEATEDAEEMEEQSRSISGGKRKRGKNSKSTGRVPTKKKVEEDVCFICFDGGELVLCDRRGCPKAYHPSCVNRDEAFFRAKGKWNCGWHICSNCEKNAYYMCLTCTFSLCKGCIKDAVILLVRGNKGFCETCMRTVMLIERKEQGNIQMGQVDFDDKNSWEYLFKDYYTDLKRKLSLTFDELTQAKNPRKGSDIIPARQESPDELYDANNDRGSHSDSSSENVEMTNSKRRKAKKRMKSRSKGGDSQSTVTAMDTEGSFADDSSEWASKELLEFVMHMRNGDVSVLSQFDVQALLLEYIKRNKLRDPRRKSQIICDARLQNLFGKPRVGHFEMLKLLESHFLLKEDSQAEDLQGSVVDTEVSHLEGDGNSDSHLKAGKDKKRKSRKKGDERGSRNLDDYAAIDNHNINLIYLRRNLVEDLLEDTEKFNDKVVGSFVRIRISGSGQKQDLYRLVQVVGTCKSSEPYKVGKRTTDILLEILNLNKTEIVSIDIISNQEFKEDECKRLRQSIKCGLINRLTVGDIQEKALTLQEVRVKDWLETEILRLSHLRDRASEKGRRKELRECVEKLQVLKTPEERQRRLEEIPEIRADPNMDPSYESEEDEDEIDDKRQENYMRPRGTAFSRRGREAVSPGRGSSISNDSWSGARNYPNLNRELSRNLSNKGFSMKGDDVPNANEVLDDAQLLQRRDRETQLSSSWERQKISSSFESGARNAQPVVSSESFSTSLSEASGVPSSTSIVPPAVKINETEKMWNYQDPSGKVQGPFSMVQLRKWSNTGYFPTELRIWRTTEKQDESILLTDALAGKFSKDPPVVDKTFAKAQFGHDLHSSLYSMKPHLPVQGTEGPVGGRTIFDQNSGSRKSLGSMSAPLTVEVPKNPTNGWGSDAGIRHESTNLPSPTPAQTTPGKTKGQRAFENQWSPTPVQSAGSLLGNQFPGSHGGLQAPAVMIPENVVPNAQNSQPGINSAPKSETGLLLSSTDISRVHPQAAAAAAPVMADTSTNTGVDIKPPAVNMQNLVVTSHNSHAETQGWRSGLVPKPEIAGSIQLRGGEPQAWGGAPSQRLEPINPATMPAQPPPQGQWGDASSVQNAASFSTGNPTGNFPTPGFPSMPTPEPWRPPSSSNQSSNLPPGPPNIPWGMGVAENQNTGWGVMPGNPNISWGGPLPANMNINWMSGQGPAPGNPNPGWVAPSQVPSQVNSVSWAAPGQGPPQVNTNAGWVVPGQGLAPGSANPGWAASSGNPGVWGSEQSHTGDRFQNQGDPGPNGGDSAYGGGKPWNRQSSFNNRGGGGSSRPPFMGQRGICLFYKNGHCKKGSSCDYIHN
ncbi:hypothetical protein L6164_037558 [Bauhinia variegata]|uniref:Uncharacterized protein n=1 Tax=Bauhinia variegata TaxID=167791 RepID=A0ACB9KKK0_BAUVA|nr:hypothetical protein L6164_037558 [Bauhinia variegata]